MFCGKFFRSLILLWVVCVGVAVTGAQQPAAPAASRTIAWTLIAGSDNEAFFAIPKESVIHASQDYYTGPNRVRVDSQKTLVSSIGDAIVQIDFYKGDARGLQKYLFEEVSGSGKKIEFDNERLGFRIAETRIDAGSVHIRRYFVRKLDRLYVLTGASRDAASTILKEFFESVMLVNDGMVMSPVISDKVAEAAKVKMLLPKAHVVRANAVEETEAVDEAGVEKPAAVIFQPALNFPPVDSRFDRTFNLIRVKVLLKSDGTVGEFEAITKTSRAIEEQALSAAKGIKFLPAEKDGKPVSVYRTITFSLGIG